MSDMSAGPARRPRPQATRSVCCPLGTPARSSSAEAPSTAAWRGSVGAPGIGRLGSSTTIVTRAAPRTSSSSGGPSSGKRRASRTAAATSATIWPGGGGRSTTASSGTFRTATPDPARRGTRATAGDVTAVEEEAANRLDGDAEDAHRRGAGARRRAREGLRALPRRRQQPRLPRLLRAARGARDDRGLPDERPPRLHEHALQAAPGLPARRASRSPGTPGRSSGSRRSRRTSRSGSRRPTS